MYFISGEEKSEQIIFSNSKSLRALEIFLDSEKLVLTTDILNELVFLGDKKKKSFIFFHFLTYLFSK